MTFRWTNATMEPAIKAAIKAANATINIGPAQALAACVALDVKVKPGPCSLATTNGVSFDVLSWCY